MAVSPIKRTATARWHGRGTDGTGHLTTGSTILDNCRYSYHTRFEEGIGTNPEELIAAAHAGCFAMKLAFGLQAAGFSVEYIDARCEIVLQEGCIRESNITVEASVPRLPAARFQELVDDARQNCPVSQVLRVDTRCTAQLREVQQTTTS
ncbi:OsmC family peroxiredoxin [Hymenobacter sublimis]|uniref:OsmC family peroxiredoxin n=1 Tax=Hymenobacter sublimis TaxID=2933777 RepID=A0ABY4J6M0_9BACT|nr:OsmC family peroxiredoxin [Hymenobacter sublimis]UPL47613.1 OsmC family peroxiredoxin [Hymenobacter sublimis]